MGQSETFLMINCNCKTRQKSMSYSRRAFLYHFLKEGWLCEFIRSDRKIKNRT